jgi:predicted GNAT superfamily acetyltransferase
MSAGAAISELRELEDLRELEGLFTAIWERPEVPPVNSDILRALAHSGNYVVGARLGNRLVGGLVGWLGGLPPHELHMHSHILGVVTGSQVRGLGFDLKQHQRRWCLERGVKVVEWTTDPLVRRNAYFNLSKLGAQAREYLVNFYGVMADGLNVGEESDRILISWQLDSSEAWSATTGHATEPDVDELLRSGLRRAGCRIIVRSRPYLPGAGGHRRFEACGARNRALLEDRIASGARGCSRRRLSRERGDP